MSRTVAIYGLLCLIWGTTWAVIEIGLRGVPPLMGVSIRFAVAGSLLLALAWVRRVPLGRSRIERRLWVANGILSFAISYGITYMVEQWVPPNLTAVLFATYPFFVALLAIPLLPDERITRRELLGIVVGFFGVGVIFAADLSSIGAHAAGGAALMLISPLAAALASVVIKRWGSQVHPFSLTAPPMLLASVITGVLALVFERGRPVTWDATSIGAILYLAIFGSAVTFTLYYKLLAELPAKRMALVAYVVPLVALALGVVRGEPITLRVLAGSLIVVAGVALAVERSFSR